MILLNSVVLVLNETIEAGILISVLLSISQRLKLPAYWWRWATLLGLSGALLYALILPTLSGWFDYSGQEVVNSALQLTIFVIALLLITRIIAGETRGLALFFTLAMGLAMVREGAEVVVFYLGVTALNEPIASVFTSGFVGLTIGASVGALSYYLLLSIRPKYAGWIQLGVLALISSGMVLQASQLLMQIDWLPSSAPLWNSENLLAENSAFGQLAYALLGYESTPGLTEVALYCGALLLCAGTALIARNRLSAQLVFDKRGTP